jgi:Uncharacterized conserved protein (DUF2304).
MVKRGREDIALFLMSGFVGIGLMIVAVYPNIFEFIASVMGLELKARAILVISNLTLFVIVTYLFNRISKMYEKISELNEELSLLRTTVDEQRVDGPPEQDDLIVQSFRSILNCFNTHLPTVLRQES